MSLKFVIGYASLLSEQSVLRHFPQAKNFTKVRLRDHARCFNSFGSLSLKKNLAEKGSEYLSHAAGIVRRGTDVLALAFELNPEDFHAYERHEFRYSLKHAEVQPLAGGEAFPAVLCYENVDHLINPALADASSLIELYEIYGVQSLWHTGHLPAKHYLQHCLRASLELGEDFLDNFLDTSFLGDRATSIRVFLETEGFDPYDYAKDASLSHVF